MPALGKVKEQAKKVVCGSNLRQQGIGFSSYAGDNNGKMPHRITPDHWPYGAQSFCSSQATYNYNSPEFFSGQAQLLYDGYFDDPAFMYCPAAKKGQFNLESMLVYQNDFASSGNVDDWHFFETYVGYPYLVGYNVHPNDAKPASSGGWGKPINVGYAKVLARDANDRADKIVACDLAQTTLDNDDVPATTLAWNDAVTYNHLSGGELGGMNTLYLDLSVTWRSRSELTTDDDTNDIDDNGETKYLHKRKNTGESWTWF